MAPYKIVIFSGDHCGPEVTSEAVKVLKIISKTRPSVDFDLQDHLLGGASIDKTGDPLTDEALSAAKSADAVLLGAIGGPKWSSGGPRPEAGLLKLRKSLGAFGNLRPCSFASPSLLDISPLKEHIAKDVNFTVVRELTGGIYFGDGIEASDENNWEKALDEEPYSRMEIERIARLAGVMARQHAELTGSPCKVTSLDKANVLRTSRLWRHILTEVFAKEFPEVKLIHQLIDSAALLMVTNPRTLNGVVVTSNLFGDIITDEASGIPGSLGLSPSASLCGIPDGESRISGIYEPIHGSAPDIAGNGVVNPIAAILSVAMMLQYSLQLPEEAKLIEEAVRRTIDRGVKTKDIGGTASTQEVGNAVVQELETLLKQ